MEKLREILKNYLNNGSDRIDVTMVLSLIDQCEKYDNKQLLLHNVSQQRELLLAFLKCYNNGEVTEYGVNEVDDFLKHNS